MTKTRIASRFHVESYDNYNMEDWMTNGEFDSADAAIACAQGVINKFLANYSAPGISASDLYTSFLCHGEVPCIHNSEGLRFEPYEYLKRRIREITGEDPPLNPPAR